MKSSKKSSSQKKIILIIVIVGVSVLVTIILLLIGSLAILNNSTQPNLAKTETKDYIFYYPNNYLMSTKKPNQDTVLYYYFPDGSYNDDDGLGIRLDIEPLLKRNSIPSAEFCRETAQSSYESSSIVKAVSVDYGQTHGCEFLYSRDINTKNIQDKVISHEKYLWFKEKQDFSVVAAKAIYFDSTPQEEKQALDLSVDKFILK